jgi:hypothetical protein
MEPHLHRLVVGVGAEHKWGKDEPERTLFHDGTAAAIAMTAPPGDKP